MSATVADILRGAGFAPVVPALPRPDRDKESKAASRVPAAPVVPVEKYKSAIAAANLRQGVKPEPLRVRLVRLAKAERRDPTLIDRIALADLPEYAGMTDAQLVALLSMLPDDADREAGRVPTGDTAKILCRSCGPVWVHPAIARMLPMVGGWPRALGCPWCFIRARGIAIPRPHVVCVDCRHRIPATTNLQGMGRCAVGNESATWPCMRHRCADFRPAEETR